MLDLPYSQINIESVEQCHNGDNSNTVNFNQWNMRFMKDITMV